MKAEFNELVKMMDKYELYQEDDEVGIALKNLRDKVFEIENETIPLTTFESEFGSVTCDCEGNIFEIKPKLVNGERNRLFDIDRLNFKEFADFVSENNLTSGERNNLLCISYWKKDGSYIEYDKEVRKYGA
jgi:hypothetical protein